MTPEQKKRIAHEISNWNNAAKSCLHPATETGDRMAALLQELIEAPAPEPVARVTDYYAGYLSVETVDGKVLSTGTALYAAPPAPAPSEDFEDALEKAFWEFDALRKGYKKNTYQISERDAFKQILRSFVHEHGRAEPPADVAQDAELLRKLKHSIRQAKVSGNDWRRELELMSSMIDAAIAAEKGGA